MILHGGRILGCRSIRESVLVVSGCEILNLSDVSDRKNEAVVRHCAEKIQDPGAR